MTNGDIDAADWGITPTKSGTDARGPALILANLSLIDVTQLMGEDVQQCRIRSIGPDANLTEELDGT